MISYTVENLRLILHFLKNGTFFKEWFALKNVRFEILQFFHRLCFDFHDEM